MRLKNPHSIKRSGLIFYLDNICGIVGKTQRAVDSTYGRVYSDDGIFPHTSHVTTASDSRLVERAPPGIMDARQEDRADITTGSHEVGSQAKEGNPCLNSTTNYQDQV